MLVLDLDRATNVVVSGGGARCSPPRPLVRSGFHQLRCPTRDPTGGPAHLAEVVIVSELAISNESRILAAPRWRGSGGKSGTVDCGRGGGSDTTLGTPHAIAAAPMAATIA